MSMSSTRNLLTTSAIPWRKAMMRLASRGSTARLQSTSAMDTVLEYLRNDLHQASSGSIEISDNPYERDRHGRGESFHPVQPPGLVVFPTNTHQVQDIVRSCVQYRIPMVPFGAGTCVEGQLAAPVPHAVSIDLSKMNQILHLPEINPQAAANDDDDDNNNNLLMPPDPYVIVQAGVTRLQLQQALRTTGYQFTVDPGANATLGGMVATGAAGTTTVRYGTMRENLLGLEAVLANDDATVLRTGSLTTKNSAGYDLTRLLCGSEGTLAIVTQATLRVWPVPACVVAGRLTFDSLADAAHAVAIVTSLGVDLVRCELLDAASVQAFTTYQQQSQQQSSSSSSSSDGNNKAAEPSLPCVPTLFLELQGSSDEILQHHVTMVEEALMDHTTATNAQWATNADERQALWKARHSLYYAAIASRPEATGALVTDACVPLSQLAFVLNATAADVQAAGIVGPCFGHAGDGSFHCILPVSQDDTQEYWAAVHRVNDNLLQRTLAVGGTVTGEHGVGVGKRKYLSQQYGDGAVHTMQLVKQALDPYHLLNPGKVLFF